MIALTQDRLRQLLSYDSESGEFHWREDRGSAVRAGQIAGTVNSRKCRIIRIDGEFYKAHRLAWFYYYGRWPRGFLDHVNFNSEDNRISNLREATMAENQRNRGPQKNNTTGYKGVVRDKTLSSRWCARITVDKKQIHLGSFSTPEAAHQAYAEAARLFHGEFARTD